MFQIKLNRLEDYKEAKRNCPKVLCIDSLQKEIFANMYFAACSYIGGLENTMSDYGEGTEEYIEADETLSNHDELVGTIWSMCLGGFYSCGLEGPEQKYQKIYNTAGNKFIEYCAEGVVSAMGY